MHMYIKNQMYNIAVYFGSGQMDTEHQSASSVCASTFDYLA